MKMIKRLALLASLLALAACATPANKASTVNKSVTPDTAVTTQAAPEPSPTEDSVAHFGRNHGMRWTDGGIEASVLTVALFKPTEWNSGYVRGQKAIKFQVRITNTGTESFDLSLVQVDLKAGPDGVQCAQIYDEGLSDFTGSVTPKHSASAWYGFSVPAVLASGDLDLEVTPSFDFATATLEGRAPFHS
jgi:hypothetical protein